MRATFQPNARFDSRTAGFEDELTRPDYSPERDLNQGEAHTSCDLDVESDGFTNPSAAHGSGSPRRQRTWPEKFRDAFRGVAARSLGPE